MFCCTIIWQMYFVNPWDGTILSFYHKYISFLCLSLSSFHWAVSSSMHSVFVGLKHLYWKSKARSSLFLIFPEFGFFIECVQFSVVTLTYLKQNLLIFKLKKYDLSSDASIQKRVVMSNSLICLQLDFKYFIFVCIVVDFPYFICMILKFIHAPFIINFRIIWSEVRC